jgi:putative peptidoglycan lipid II flippase
MDLLDPALSPPTALELAADLRRFDVDDSTVPALYEAEEDDEPHRSRWMKAVLPLVSVLLVALIGWVIGTSDLLGGGGAQPFPSSDDPTNPEGSGRAAVLPVSAVKILDPGGDGAELGGAALAADGNPATAWKTDVYTRPNFGNIAGKVGMGVRVDLGEAKSVRKVTVQLGAAGATLELRRGSGSDDPEAYRTVGTREDADQSVTFAVPAGVSDRYWLVWITSLPPENDGYGIEVQEIVVSG